RHRRAAVGRVAAGHGADDADARGAQVDAAPAVVGPRGLGVGRIGGGDRDDVGQVVARRVTAERGAVVVVPVVAGGGDDQVAVVAGVDAGAVDVGGIAAAPTVVRHQGTVVDGVADGG